VEVGEDLLADLPADLPMGNIEFDLELPDGRIGHCWRAQAQPYADCVFSSGLVTGLEPDVFYIRFEREGDPLTILLRTDELMAVLWVGNGALWAAEMLERDGNQTIAANSV